MSTNVTRLLAAIVEACQTPDTRTFVLGWCLAGCSHLELQHLKDAIDEFEKVSTGDKYLDLITERFGQPKPL